MYIKLYFAEIINFSFKLSFSWLVKRVVLQKFCKDRKSLLHGFRLCSHSSGLVDAENPLFDRSSETYKTYPFRIMFIISYLLMVRRAAREGAKSHPWFDQSFYPRVVLLNNIIRPLAKVRITMGRKRLDKYSNDL